MSIHNISFHVEIRKLLCGNPILSRAKMILFSELLQRYNILFHNCKHSVDPDQKEQFDQGLYYIEHSIPICPNICGAGFMPPAS